jgi:WD40 repeat protein
MSVAFSPDGLKLASGSWCNIRIWRTVNAELLLHINAHQDYVRDVVWTPDSQRLVSASNDKTARFWDSSTGYQIGQPCTGHTSHILSLVISFDGSLIATASDDKTVRLWSTESRHQIRQPFRHAAFVFCLAISPNGELLVSGDADGKVRLWSMKNTLSAAIQLYSSSDSYFAHRSKVNLEQNLYLEALSDAEKVRTTLIIF